MNHADGRDTRATPAVGPAGATPEELLGRVAGGDQVAFGELYEVIAPPVFGLAHRVVSDEAQAEEVCQEVLIEVWRSASRFDPGRGGAVSWAMMITHRRAVDRVRSVRASVERDHHSAVREYQGAFDEVNEEVERRLEDERVRHCLTALTPLQRESVLLAYYDGFTYRETAERLATALNTVKTRMRDGLIRLRDCLGDTA